MGKTDSNETTTYDDTFELAWIEINKRFQLVSKRREFKTPEARTRFVDKLLNSGNLYEILSSRN